MARTAHTPRSKSTPTHDVGRQAQRPSRRPRALSTDEEAKRISDREEMPPEADEERDVEEENLRNLATKRRH